MRSRKRLKSQLPEVNLVPMMDVLMTVLTFFIIVSMTLSTAQGLDVELPSQQADPTQPDTQPPDPLIVTLAQGDQIVLNDEPILKPDLEQRIQSYLAENEDGAVLITPEEQLPYEDVIQFLAEMKAVGGDRVSLALE